MKSLPEIKTDDSGLIALIEERQLAETQAALFNLRHTLSRGNFYHNPRVRYDEEDEVYELMVDNIQGDKGHPLIVTYWQEIADALAALLSASAPSGEPVDE